MKKISRKDLQGLRRQFPVLSKDDMRHYVGGYDGGGYFSGGTGYGWGDGYGDFGGGSGGYWGGSSDSYYDNAFNYWLTSGNYFYDENGNFFWSNGDYFTDAYGNPFMYGGSGNSEYGYGYNGEGGNYNKIDFTQNSSQIGYGVINAMRQYFVNHVGDMRELVDFDSTRWGQGGPMKSNYFNYNGKEVQWTVVNGTAAANNYREVYSLATSDKVENPAYNNYEIQVKFSDWGVALRLRTSDYETYKALLDAVKYPCF